MYIDSHQHFWQYNEKEYGWIDDKMAVLKRDFLPEHLLNELNSFNFDGSIVVQARQTLDETNWLLQLADNYPFIKGVVGWVDLMSDDVEEQMVQFAHHPKLVGVRHVLHDEVDINFMLRPQFINGIKLLEKFNFTYDILIYPKHIKNTIELVRQCSSKQIFVVDHVAKPLIKEELMSPWQEDIAELAKFPNVYCKVSGLVTEANWKSWQPHHFKPYLDVVFGCFGPERILIGSDWPVCLVAGEYSNVMNIILDYMSDFSEKDKNLVLGLNAQKVYK